MQIKLLITALALLVNVAACANHGSLPDGAQLVAPLHSDGSAWAEIDRAGRLLIGGAVIAEQAELIDSLDLGHTTLVAAVTGSAMIPYIYQVRGAKVEASAALPAPDFLPETLCLADSGRGGAALFLVDERGKAEHWQVYAEGLIAPLKVRDLPLPPNTVACDADRRGGLFVVEDGVAVWRYAASAERPPGRELIDLAEPYGQLPGGAAAITLAGDDLIAVAAASKDIWAYGYSAGQWRGRPIGQWQGLAEAESLYAWSEAGTLQLVTRDDETDRILHTSVPYQPAEARGASNSADLAAVRPVMETAPVARFGDAADDPAIWVHPRLPALSRILATDKKHGLAVYNLQGQQLAMLATGRLNNVDLRYGFDFGDGVADIAVASQRDHNSLSVYRIHPADGTVTHLAELATGLQDIYGLCLYQNAAGTYAIANGKSGRFEQYLLTADRGRVKATLVRSFALASQPEGCVADDQRGQLFIGEEDVGIWTLPARAEDTLQLELIKAVDDQLVADVEGLALYPAVNSRYLIASSQGDDSYLVLNARPPYQVLGKFRVVANLAQGIDGVSETDGLEVTHRPLGAGLESGAFIAQDGHNVMPEQPQNFKLVPWQDIAKELKLND